MRTPKIQKTETALSAFITHKAELDAEFARLQQLSGEHFNVSADDVHWGHVGDLSRYLELLRQITDAAFKEGAHAE